MGRLARLAEDVVIHPVILGAGVRLFTTPHKIEPVSTITFSGGAVASVLTAHR